MGIWSDIGESISDGFSKASDARRAAQAAEREAIGKAVGNAAHSAGEAVGGARPFKAMFTAPGKMLRKGTKFGLIGGGVVAGVAALGLFANNRRNEARKASRDAIANETPQADELPPIMQPQLSMPVPQEVPGPAEGPQGEWTQRIAAERGGMAAQVNPAAQPTMSVVPESSVQNLGAPAPTR